jgi:hypothetical protein
VENFTDAFGELVEQRLQALHTTPFAVEKAHDLKPDSIRNVLRSARKAGPTLSRAEEICRALDLEFYIGPKRQSSGFSEDTAASDLHRVEAMRAGYLPIPWHYPVAGSGSSPVALDSRWLDENGIVPDNLTALMPDDVLLADSPASAPLVIIDAMAPRVGGPSLWCFREAGRNTLARLQFDAGITLVVPAHADQAIRVLPKASAAITILGRTVWRGGLEK